jgi:hypothetical protein
VPPSRFGRSPSRAPRANESAVPATPTTKATSPALVADGNHARLDGFVSLGVVTSAILVASASRRPGPINGLAFTLVILKITRDSWRVVTPPTRANSSGQQGIEPPR